jgi:hypothetical protein
MQDTPSPFDDLARPAAERLTGLQRRSFMAEVAVGDYARGGKNQDRLGG